MLNQRGSAGEASLQNELGSRCTKVLSFSCIAPTRCGVFVAPRKARQERVDMNLLVSKAGERANVTRELDRPAHIISHNKPLAAHLYSEFKQFFPHNALMLGFSLSNG